MPQNDYVGRTVHDPERGRRIAVLRERSGMTQPAAAEAVGVALRTYQLWEAGHGISWRNLERLAGAFGTSVELILDTSESTLRRIEDKIDRLLELLDRED